MKRPILTVGDPLLEQVAREVTREELPGAEVQSVIDDLHATLKGAGGLGLAAPQIGHALRIALLASPPTVLVNPVVTPVGEETQVALEACLSVPGMQGEVRRPARVRVQALGRTGKQIDQIYVGQRACVVQHEVDHLDGILYTTRALVMQADGSQRIAAEPEAQRQKQQTLVIDSEEPVGGNRHITWTFSGAGRVVAVRIQPGGALVTGAYLSGVKLRARGYKAGAAQRFLVGTAGLHVACGDQLRLDLQLVGKRRIVAEADVDWVT